MSNGRKIVDRMRESLKNPETKKRIYEGFMMYNYLLAKEIAERHDGEEFEIDEELTGFMDKVEEI